ncbi:MAG: AmmeMemoRadiSam system radical SAM enzyme [Candidatus Aenigmarchaeota archaeon]|nr:AmmeMemoRadiSam system radical SAM enzyme [Candidatus Aenigmarchaeota archaeon]
MKYKEARYYSVVDKEKHVVKCGLCPNECVIPEGSVGSCMVRKNVSGKLYSLNYGMLVCAGLDPIEKKPLYHFMPSTMTFSIATCGCNLHCRFCQNYEVSQSESVLGEYVSAEAVVEMAKEQGVKSISYTYTEPTIFFEYMIDVAKLAKKAGMKNIVVSNGYINPEPLRELVKYIDAANIDIKSVESGFYQKFCGVKSVDPVINTVKLLKSAGVHVEVTNLLIETLNTSDKQIRELCRIVASIDKEIPLHFSAFYPAYKMVEGFRRTESHVLRRAKEIAVSEGIKYVYLGNIGADEDTLCSVCGAVLVRRKGYDANVLYSFGKCKDCGKNVPFKG